MGIRFLCEHCNRRLNVKQTQAGQVGLCIHCRKPLVVPHQSTLKPKARKSQKSAVSQTDSRFLDPEDDRSTEESEILDADEQVTMEGLQAGEHQAT